MKKVAIVGCGPAGMHAALLLAREKFSVEIFEREKKPGGMLQYYLPKFRFSRDGIAKKIKALKALGIKIHYNSPIGAKNPLEKIASKFNAVLLAPGAWKARPLPIPGIELRGVSYWIEFLRDYNSEKIKSLAGKKVVVIGAGDTAMDCARAAQRLGAKALIAYRKGKKEMRANSMEVNETEKDGIEFIFHISPSSFNGKGKLEQIEFEGKNGKEVLDADLALIAIGQIPCSDFFDGSSFKSLESLPQNIVPAGDLVNDNKLISTAIASATDAVGKIRKIIDN